MNPTRPPRKVFGVGLACGLLLGAGAGYMGAVHLAAGTSDSELAGLIPDSQKRAPRFGASRSEIPETNRKTAPTQEESLRFDTMFSKYSRFTPDQIREELDRLYGENRMDRSFESLFADFYLNYRWGHLAPKQALEYSQKRGPASFYSYSRIIQGWADTHPEAAAAYFLENRNNLPMGKEMLCIITRSMGRLSPDSALKWLSGMEDMDRKLALPALMSGIAEKHPENIKDYVGKLDQSALKDRRLTDHIAREWSCCDWAAAREWMETLPESGKNSALLTAMEGLAKTNPDQALQEYYKLPASLQADALYPLICSMTEKSPVKTLEWIAQNVPDDQREKITRAALNYTRYDSEEVREYITKMHDGPAKDTALETLVQNTAGYADANYINYEKTLSLSLLIRNEQKRQASTGKVLTTWINDEAEKARKWISSSSLPEEEKRNYLKECDARIEKG